MWITSGKLFATYTVAKGELVDRLLMAERSSAEWEQRFLAHQDDVFSWRLRAEAAEKRLQLS